MVTGWQSISGATYYFQEDGAAKTGWLKENGKLYYFGADAQLCTGWQTIDGKRYCFRPAGSAVIGCQKAAHGFRYYFVRFILYDLRRWPGKFVCHKIPPYNLRHPLCAHWQRAVS